MLHTSLVCAKGFKIDFVIPIIQQWDMISRGLTGMEAHADMSAWAVPGSDANAVAMQQLMAAQQNPGAHPGALAAAFPPGALQQAQQQLLDAAGGSTAQPDQAMQQQGEQLQVPLQPPVVME